MFYLSMMSTEEGITFVVKVKHGNKVAAFIASAYTCDAEALEREGFEKLPDGNICDDPVVILSAYHYTQVDTQTRRISGSARIQARYRLPGSGWDRITNAVTEAGFSRWYEIG